MAIYVANIPVDLPFPSSPDELYTIRVTWDGTIYEDTLHHVANSQEYWYIGDISFENFPFYMRITPNGLSTTTNVEGYHDVKIEIVYPNNTMDAKYAPQIYVVYLQEGSISDVEKMDLASALNELAYAASEGTASDISFSWIDPRNT